MRIVLSLIIAAMLFAGVAWAVQTGGWTTQPDGSVECFVLSPGTNPRGGRVCYYDFNNTQDSVTLNVSACESVNIHFDPDEDGTNTGAEVQMYRCSEGSFSTNHCHKILGDTDGDGVNNDVTLDGDTNMRVGFQQVQAAYIAVDVTANGSSDDARVTVECHGS